MSAETKIIGGTGSEKPGRVALLAVLLTWLLLFLAALQFVRTYGSKDFPQNTTILLEHKKNGIGIFKDIRDAPPLHSSTLALEPASLDGLAQHGAILDGAGSLTFTLPKPEHVYAVRLRYHYIRTQNAWCTMRVYWRNSIAEDFTDAHAQFSTAPGPDQPNWAPIDGIIRVDAKLSNDRTLNVWINGIIDQVRIYPDTAPAESKLSDIELLQ